MPPLPTQHCPYECLRADSEDSGLGPSPAKSLVNPTSPASPLQFCGDSDSLLDLSPRTDNSYESDKGPEDPFYNLDKTPAKNSSAFKFLLSSSGSPHHQTTQFSSLRGGESSTESSPSPFCEEDHPFQTARGSSQEDYLRQATPSPLLADGESSTSPSSFFDEQACRDDHPFQTSLPSSPHRQATQFPSPLLGGDESSTSPNSFFDEQACRDEDPTFQTIQNSHHRLNPQVLLIRSNFGESGGYGELTTTSSDCTSSNCSQVDPQGSSNSVGTDDGDCKWLGCNRSADDNTTATDLIDHIRQCHVQSQSDDSKSYVCLWVGCKRTSGSCVAWPRKTDTYAAVPLSPLQHFPCSFSNGGGVIRITVAIFCKQRTNQERNPILLTAEMFFLVKIVREHLWLLSKKSVLLVFSSEHVLNALEKNQARKIECGKADSNSGQRTRFVSQAHILATVYLTSHAQKGGDRLLQRGPMP
ncbi:uncharacterized protein TNCV_542991 [Trichonephila clavipes]|nr:uncharacterized protein TNCV_542991 [Trichonephila clavipes]